MYILLLDYNIDSNSFITVVMYYSVFEIENKITAKIIYVQMKIAIYKI